MLSSLGLGPETIVLPGKLLPIICWGLEEDGGLPKATLGLPGKLGLKGCSIKLDLENI